jgi:xanthosine utilization system XapX-like protein
MKAYLLSLGAGVLVELVCTLTSRSSHLANSSWAVRG